MIVPDVNLIVFAHHKQSLYHLQNILDAVGGSSNLVPDAHIAALAIEHQTVLHSHDSDFGRIPGLQWHNPL